MQQEPQAQYAGFWIRVLASTIDSVICLIPSLIFSSFVPIVGGLVINFIYKPFFESSELMATPGKALLGMRVTTMDQKRISFGVAFARLILGYVSAILLGIGYLMAAFTKRKQTLHDLILDTVVVYGPHNQKNYLEAWTDQVEWVFTSGFRKKSSEGSKEVTDLSASDSSIPGSTDNASTSTAAQDLTTSESEGLQKLNQLLASGLITEEEYQNLKKQYAQNLE